MKIPPDQWIIASCDNKIIILVVQNSENYLCKLEEHTDLIYLIGFSLDGQLFSSGEDNLSCSSDQTIECGTCKNKRKYLNRLDIQRDLIYQERIIIDILQRRHDNQILELNYSIGNIKNLNSFQYYPQVAISPNQKQLISCSNDQSIKLWDIDGHKGTNLRLVIQMKLHAQNAQSFLQMVKNLLHAAKIKQKEYIMLKRESKFQNSKDIKIKQLISCSLDNTIKLWDVIIDHEIKNIDLEFIKSQNRFAHSIGISFYQSYLACRYNDGSIFILDISDTSRIIQKHILDKHNQIITSITFSSKQKILVSGSYDQQIIIWNYHTGQQIKKRNSNQEFIFSLNGQNIIFICKDKLIRVRNTKLENDISILEGKTDVVLSLAFSEFGLISGSKDRSIRINLSDIQGRFRQRINLSYIQSLITKYIICYQ